MTKQCEVIAVSKTKKDEGLRALTEANKIAQKADLFSGRIRRYIPLREDGVQHPEETTRCQMTVTGLLEAVSEALVPMFDVVRTLDEGNTLARGDIVVEDNGTEIFRMDNVPATHLIWLEKQVKDLVTFLGNLPLVDPASDWVADQGTGMLKTEAAVRLRTEKVQVPLELSPATDKHAAQVQLITRDEPVGNWHETLFSGAIDLETKRRLVRRATSLLEAVRTAREQANSTEVLNAKEGEALLGFLFS